MTSYFAYNGPMVTTAPYTTVAVPTTATTKTILSIIAGPNDPLIVWKWGLDFDGTGTTPIKCELIHTTESVHPTVTSYKTADIQPLGGVQSATSALVNTSNVSSAAYSGYNATAEGTITATRYGSINTVYPGTGDRNEWSLGREFYIPAGGTLRIRITPTAAGVTSNIACYVCWDD